MWCPIRLVDHQGRTSMSYIITKYPPTATITSSDGVSASGLGRQQGVIKQASALKHGQTNSHHQQTPNYRCLLRLSN